jgi:hypothetical protein
MCVKLYALVIGWIPVSAPDTAAAGAKAPGCAASFARQCLAFGNLYDAARRACGALRAREGFVVIEIRHEYHYRLVMTSN